MRGTDKAIPNARPRGFERRRSSIWFVSERKKEKLKRYRGKIAGRARTIDRRIMSNIPLNLCLSRWKNKRKHAVKVIQANPALRAT
jgi:hypothetical protein